MNILLAIINILFNPFSFLIFIAFSFKKNSYFFTKEATNVTKLKLVPYLCFYSIYLIVILSLTYLCSLYIDFNIWDVFVPKNLLISAVTWLITGFTLRVYLKGMEGNIMGFIFFPLLALSILTLTVFSFFDVLSYQKLLTLQLSELKINFWIRLLIHSFCPFYIILFLTNNNVEKENPDWIAPLISSLILQVLFFSINWVIIYLFGNSLTFSQFFGEGETIIYYIPMIGGFLLFILFFISKIISTKKNEQYKLETISYYVTFINFGLIILEAINYLNLISSSF
ncbi:hypothetical protein [Tenacibaculum retecalamus]|uniref:hypothetical protein n=1 Tax=Tenacibaculum retecalamus TaxID=3018315 RepID=UPI0023D96C9F|nr:hypothetical protein [Tenacibaculum retecalamus]WBX71465.1 hypothetical protein PG912_01305 [Tenacibaculum retecalamus]